MTLSVLIAIAKKWALAGRPECTHSMIETEVEASLKALSATLDRIELAARRARAEALQP